MRINANKDNGLDDYAVKKYYLAFRRKLPHCGRRPQKMCMDVYRNIE